MVQERYHDPPRQRYDPHTRECIHAGEAQALRQLAHLSLGAAHGIVYRRRTVAPTASSLPMDGTSMATPMAAGSVALLLPEMHIALGQNPTHDTIKALEISIQAKPKWYPRRESEGFGSGPRLSSGLGGPPDLQALVLLF